MRFLREWYLRRKYKRLVTLREFRRKGVFEKGALCDSQFVALVKELRSKFNLLNFVETGTHEGETSFFFSGIFDWVFTCDVRDYPKRAHFYFKDNIVYEVMDSPEFLRKHLAQISEHSIFFLDAHWEKRWPLREELQVIFSRCELPIVLIDDFDVGHGLSYDTYQGKKLDFDYIKDLIPSTYHSFMNSTSSRGTGWVALLPPNSE